MLQLQRTFKESYFKTLRDAAKSGESLPLYSNSSFEIDQTQIKSLANVYAPEGLAVKLIPSSDGDYDSAIAVYEAFKNISPLLASNETFWAYITHTIMFDYTQKRWPNVVNGTASPDYVLDHWFVGSKGILRNAAAALWWGVFSTIDESRENKYELTRILFKNYTMRVNTFGSSLLIRHREAMIGILNFLHDNPEIMQKSEPRCLFITKYFNRLGSSKQLVYMDRTFFYNTLLRIKGKIMMINTREETNHDYLYSDND